MKYPIGIQSFEKIRQNGFVYVDKTALIYDLVTKGTIYFLSRPRRFGKSLLVSTLKAYFEGRKELFAGLAMEQLEQQWTKYPVFHIDFNGSNFTKEGTLESLLEKHISEWERQYECPSTNYDYGIRFIKILKQAHDKYGKRAVVLIDEYDKPLLDVIDTDHTIEINGERRPIEEENRDILKGFYSVFKAADDDLQFVLLTGETKFSQGGLFSGFNQHADISIDHRYEALCGITEDELYSYFDKSIKELSDEYDMGIPEMKELLKQQYNGYHFSGKLTDIYNPFSLLNAFAFRHVDDYWFHIATPEKLIHQLHHTNEDFDELIRHSYDPSEFVDYMADIEKPLPLLYQSGYLTIKDNNWRHNSYEFDFPNNEVRKGFMTLIANNYFQIKGNTGTWARDSVKALQTADLERFRKLLTAFLADIPYTMRRKETERERERYFHYTFYLLLRMISCYTVYTEKQQSEGRVDCIVEVPGYIYIFEFKLDGTAAEALAQINEKGYARPYAADARKLFRIGISFSSETGTIEDFAVEE